MLKLSDDDYFGLGGKTRDSIIVSASFLKDVLNRGLHKVLIEEWEQTDDLKKVLENGKQFHSYILEPKEFDKLYYMGDFNPADDRVKVENEEFLKEAKKQIKMFYPELIKEDENHLSERVFLSKDGVLRKSKLDKIVINIENMQVDIYDLKSTFLKMGKIKRDRYGNPYELKKDISEKHYDLQMAFYRDIVKDYLSTFENGSHFTINTHLVYVSTDDYKARLVTLSEETLGYGEEKMRSAMHEVEDYILNGYLNRSLVI